MVTLTHLIIAVIVTWLLTLFVCFLNVGASINNQKEEAYRTGYEQGYNNGFIDGRKNKNETAE